MGTNKHDVEHAGAKPRDHVHLRRPIWTRPHRDWRFWLAVGLMLALIVAHVMTDSLSLRPGRPAARPTPAMNGP